MSGMAKPVAYIADHLRHVLVNGASAPHTAEVEWFFKNEIQSRGWYTGELRKLARRFSRVILHDASLDYLVQVADQLFQGNVLEEKVLAVLLLQPSAAKCTPQHFELFCTWLQRVSTWADHDGLVQYLIGPMIVLDPQRNNVRGEAVISAEKSPVTVRVIPPAEDLMIVNHVVRLLAE